MGGIRSPLDSNVAWGWMGSGAGACSVGPRAEENGTTSCLWTCWKSHTRWSEPQGADIADSHPVPMAVMLTTPCRTARRVSPPVQAAGLFPKCSGFRQSRLPKRPTRPCQAVCHGPCATVLINTAGHAKSCETTADVLGLRECPAQQEEFSTLLRKVHLTPLGIVPSKVQTCLLVSLSGPISPAMQPHTRRKARGGRIALGTVAPPEGWVGMPPCPR